jgi:hypothetical protein
MLLRFLLLVFTMFVIINVLVLGLLLGDLDLDLELEVVDGFLVVVVGLVVVGLVVSAQCGLEALDSLGCTSNEQCWRVLLRSAEGQEDPVALLRSEPFTDSVRSTDERRKHHEIDEMTIAVVVLPDGEGVGLRDDCTLQAWSEDGRRLAVHLDQQGLGAVEYLLPASRLQSRSPKDSTTDAAGAKTRRDQNVDLSVAVAPAVLVPLHCLARRVEPDIVQSLGEFDHDARASSNIEQGVPVIGRSIRFCPAFPAMQLNHLSAGQTPTRCHLAGDGDETAPRRFLLWEHRWQDYWIHERISSSARASSRGPLRSARSAMTSAIGAGRWTGLSATCSRTLGEDERARR